MKAILIITILCLSACTIDFPESKAFENLLLTRLLGNTANVTTDPEPPVVTPVWQDFQASNNVETSTWQSVTYGNGLFVAISYSGTINSAMYANY